MSFLKTLPFPSSTDDIFAPLSHIVHTLIHFSSVECLEERRDRGEGGEKMDGERGGQVCATRLEQCVATCLKFGSSSPLPPLFFSLLLSHLHRNVQLDLIREAEGKSNWAWDQKPPYGDRPGSCDLIDPRGRQQRRPVSM